MVHMLVLARRNMPGQHNHVYSWFSDIRLGAAVAPNSARDGRDGLRTMTDHIGGSRYIFALSVAFAQ